MIKNILNLIIGIFSQCGGGIPSAEGRAAQLSREGDRDKRDYTEMVNAIVSALDGKNKAALKQLFGVSALNKTADIDARIDDLFLFYNGPCESIEPLNPTGGPSSTGETIEYRQRKIELNGGFIIITAEAKYYVYLEMQSRNDFNKDDEGIQALRFATERAYHSRTEFPPGLYIYTAPEDPADTIKNAARIARRFGYKAIDRHLTVDDFLAFIAKDDSISALRDTIGSPNMGWNEYSYFELENKQVVVCETESVEKQPKIKKMFVADEDYRLLYTLWEKGGTSR